MNILKAQTWGGQIIQAQLFGKDIFYCPNDIAPAPTPTRGGIPVLFPQFNDRGCLPKHGFARIAEWQVFSMLEGCVSTSLLLTEQVNWPHRAQLNVDAHLEDEDLEIFFEVRNVGESDFEWTGGLHPYFFVGDVTQTQVKGLALNFAEKNLPQIEFNQSYPVTDNVEIYSPHCNIRLSQQGYDSWMVWNPGGQHALKDIPHDDWYKFLCVEPVNLVSKKLKVGEDWVGAMKITWL